jgi:hypothetical protein
MGSGALGVYLLFSQRRYGIFLLETNMAAVRKRHVHGRKLPRIQTPATTDSSPAKENLEMKKFLCSVLLISTTPLLAIAQGGAATPATPAAGAQQMAPPTDPISTFVKAQWRQISRNLIGSVEQMPEANFTMKLGTTPEVRTYSALVGHVIDGNYVFCARAKGEANPNTFEYEKTAQTKAERVKAIHAALDYCGPVYDSLTDSSAMMMVTPPSSGRGPGRPYPMVQQLIQNIIHNNEEYGNIVGYFRVANLVPPSTAAAAAAEAGRGRGN